MPTYNPTFPQYLAVAQTRTRNGQKDVKIILDVDTNEFYTLDDDNNFILIGGSVIKYAAAQYQMLIQSPTFTIATIASGVNFLRGYYITVYDDISFDRLAISISTGVSGNSIFGIYSIKDDGYPDELLYNTVVFNNVVTGGQLSNQNGTLKKGNYLVASSSSSGATFRAITAQFLLNTFNFFGPTDGANLHVGLSVVYTYDGTLPTTFPSGAVKVTGGTTLPYLLFKTI